MKIVTANRLVDGEAVWLSPQHRWSESIEGAAIARDAAALEVLEAVGRRALDANEVVDLQTIDVEIAGGRVRPIRLRERIRAAGPSYRSDLGKQARQAAQAPLSPQPGMDQ